jgi:hypothetical protein
VLKVDPEYEIRQLEVFLEMVKKGDSPIESRLIGRDDISTDTTCILESKLKNGACGSRIGVP